MYFSNPWNIFVDNLSLFLDVSDKNDDVTVKIEVFQSIWVKTRSIDNKKRLKHTSTYANICFTIDFMKELLLKIIHHQNGLQHSRSAVLSTTNYSMVFTWIFITQKVSLSQRKGWTNLFIAHKKPEVSIVEFQNPRMKNPTTHIFQTPKNMIRYS